MQQTLYGENYKSFPEFIEGEFEGNEDSFWTVINSEGGIDSYLAKGIETLKNNGIQKVNNYTIINEDGAISNEQVALRNGLHTFTIIEITTGKTYTKTVDVNNVDTNIEFYYIKQIEDVIALVELSDRTTLTTFKNAYIKYNGKRIDITKCICPTSFVSEEVPELSGGNVLKIDIIVQYLFNTGEIESSDIIRGTTQEIEIVKDGKSHFENILMKWNE